MTSPEKKNCITGGTGERHWALPRICPAKGTQQGLRGARGSQARLCRVSGGGAASWEQGSSDSVGGREEEEEAWGERGQLSEGRPFTARETTPWQGVAAEATGRAEEASGEPPGGADGGRWQRSLILSTFLELPGEPQAPQLASPGETGAYITHTAEWP